MFTMNRVPFAFLFLAGLGVAAGAPDALGAGPAAAPAPSRSPAVQQEQAPQRALTRKKAEPALKLSKETLKNIGKLKDTERIQVGNREMTVREFKRQRLADQKQAAAKVKAMAGRGGGDLKSLQAEFEKKEAARLQAANAKVMSEMARTRKAGMEPLDAPAPTNGNGARAKIREEAAEIQARVQAGTATPADRQRAQELYEQFQQLK